MSTEQLRPSNFLPPPRPAGPPMVPPGDPILAERLARLAARAEAAHGRTVGPAQAAAASAQPSAGPRSATPAKSSTRRRHAARGSRIAALTMSLVTTGGLTAAFAHTDQAAPGDSGSTAAGEAITPVEVTPGASAAASVATTAAITEPTTDVTAPAAIEPTTAEPTAAEPTAAETTAVVAASGYADGRYVGGVSSNKWGDVQVQVVISGGEITAVETLQYPDADRKSVRINQSALPTLESQVLAAQGIDINGVSGATYTARSYVASLQSALDQAIAA